MNKAFIQNWTNSVNEIVARDHAQWVRVILERGMDPATQNPPVATYVTFLWDTDEALHLEKAGHVGEMDQLNELARLSETSPAFIIFLLNAWAKGTDPISFLTTPSAVFPQNTDEILGFMLLARKDIREGGEHHVGIVDDTPMMAHPYLRDIWPHFTQEVRYFISELLREKPDYELIKQMVKVIYPIDIEIIISKGMETRMGVDEEPNEKDGLSEE